MQYHTVRDMLSVVGPVPWPVPLIGVRKLVATRSVLATWSPALATATMQDTENLPVGRPLSSMELPSSHELLLTRWFASRQ
jgi:hypothetical protein